MTDIVGSVGLWERDERAMSMAVARHDELVAGVVSAAGGELVRSKGEGDSTFSVFEHPRRAVAAAVEVQRSVGAEPWPEALRLRLRAGVHTGDAEPRDGDWYGPAVNRAARLRGLAEADQTLVSGVTAGLVADRLPDGVRLAYRGRRVLRGIERPEEVWEALTGDRPAGAGLGAEAAGLRPDWTSFVGRGEDLAVIEGLLGTVRLVTLTGAGGSGKSRLAFEVARRVARRGTQLWTAELAALRHGEAVAEAIASACAVPGQADPLGALIEARRGTTGVLVLDNCEHVLHDCRSAVERLLSHMPGLRVLATSREALGLPGEHTWLVGPLAVPDQAVRTAAELLAVESATLLVERAREVRPGLVIGDEDVAAVVAACRALDGVPLAIELAAGRLRSIRLIDLASHLDRQPALLTRRGTPTSPRADRHASLGRALDWSYDLLSDDERRLARGLSVFAGGFRLDAVAEVCGQDDVFDGVDELVARSLVTFDPDTARHRMLEPLRQYFAEHLDQAGEADSISRAHARWVVSLCREFGRRVLTDQRRATTRLREERENLEATLLWAVARDDHQVVCQVAGELGLYWCLNDQATGRRWIDAALTASHDVAAPLRAQVLMAVGLVTQNDWDWARSVRYLTEALEIYTARQSGRGQAAAHFWLGRALASRWDPDHFGTDPAQAWTHLETSERLFDQVGDIVGASWSRTWRSLIAIWTGDIELADALATQVLDSCQRHHVTNPVGQALCNLAYIARRQGDSQRALELLGDAAATYRGLDDAWQLLSVTFDIACQHVGDGRHADALQALATCVRLDEHVGHLADRTYWLALVAAIHLGLGRPDLATGAYGAHEATTSRVGVNDIVASDGGQWARPRRSECGGVGCSP